MLMSIQVDSMNTKEFIEKWAAALVRTDTEIMEHLEILKDAHLVREFSTHGSDSRVEVTDLCDKAVVGLRDLVENPPVAQLSYSEPCEMIIQQFATREYIR